MWTIYESKNLIKTINKIPINILKYYELWKRIVELEGPVGLRLIRGFHDEALQGKWKDHRSSRLSLQWRVIYKIDGKDFEVFVIDVNPHKYK